jgi:two-component system, NarL family, sensor histidine kinase DesK
MPTQLQQAAPASVVAIPPRLGVREGGVDGCPDIVVSVTENTRTALLTRLTFAGIACYCMIFPVISVGVLISSSPGFSRGCWAVAATLASSLLYLRHVFFFIRGLRPPWTGWSLGALTVVVVGAVPLAGGWWLSASFALAVCLLTTLPWRLSLTGTAVLLAAQVPLALAFPAPDFPDVASEPSYFALDLLWRTAAVFVPIWLVRTVRQLDAARRQLAEEAVLRERLRVDAQLRGTLTTALGSIVACGERAAGFAQARPSAADAEVVALIETSRSALAETRRLLSGLRHPSLLAELESGASLLNAAGIDTRLALPAGEPPASVSASFRSRLRSTIASLLRDESARSCVLALTTADGLIQLEIQVNGKSVTRVEVPMP